MEATRDSRLQWGDYAPPPSGKEDPCHSTQRKKVECVCQRCLNKPELFANVKIPKGNGWSKEVREALFGKSKDPFKHLCEALKETTGQK